MARNLDSLTVISRRALESAFALSRQMHHAPIAVDGTAGNGHDTLFLASSVGSEGRVWAFDIQAEALEAASRRLAGVDAVRGGSVAESCLLDRVSFVHAGHETLAEVLPEKARGNVWGAMFNLGFLPGSDRLVITNPATTIAALEALVLYVPCGGVVSVHGYMGHDGGAMEAGIVSSWFEERLWDDWRVARYSFVNKKHNQEVLFLAERVGNRKETQGEESLP